MLASLAAIGWLTFAAAPAPQEPPTKEALVKVTERGRNLAGYDAAAWHASDALQTNQPREGSVAQYIAKKTDKGWMVAFGRLDKAKGKFLIAYEATPGKDAEHFDVKAFEPAKEDTGFFRSAAIAIDTSLQEFTRNFEGQKRPYNVAVLPAEKDQFWVYLVPAPTKPGVWPLGGDARYLVSADGAKIVEKRRLHKSILEIERPKDAAQKQVAGIHTHILDEIPEDTDVFHVLIRKPAVPEMIATKQFVFQVGVDGSIEFLGKSEDLKFEK
jgi:hypothetical protein